MTSLSDTLTVGLVLVLLFGSIALYLYTRIQQSEQKISLLESILLDIKMSSEIKSYDELPASNYGDTNQTHNQTEYASFDDSSPDWYPSASIKDVYVNTANGAKSPPNSPSPSVSSKVDDDEDNNNIDVEQYKSVIAEAVNDTVEVSQPLVDNSIEIIRASANYESMTIKELQTLAKSRGISGAGSMKKNAIVEALKTSDRSQQTVEPGSLGSSSFLETSSTFQITAESK
jgi:hypothetical protein